MLEVASVHVPKSAGTSFIEVLKHWYGPTLSLEYTCNGTVDRVEPWTRARHGHFRATEHEAQHLVTWMRDPAKRLVSHYFYWRVTPPVARVDPTHQMMREQNTPLLEFAEIPEMRNLTAWYLDGRDVDDFSFVGIAEALGPEVGRLARILGKPPVAPPHINDTKTAEYLAFQASSDYAATMQRIRELNSLDYELYDQARDRMQRYWDSFAA